MSTKPTHGAETWEPLAANELVFSTREDKRFIVYSGPGGTFIAPVRNRDGIWMKRVDPLKPFSWLVIRDLMGWGRYKQGAELLATIPRRRNLKAA